MGGALENIMSGALENIRIVDATTMISGPLAARILGDQGADVIKVEAPGVGDGVRVMGPASHGFSSIFATVNRNKRSIILDLKSPDGLVWMKRLVATADVFIQNFRPGTADRLGIGEEMLRAVKPDLIYMSISGFGATGPYADKKVYDPVVQALSGLAAIQADRKSGRPAMMRLVIPDKVTGLTAAQAIAAALFARERSGEGQHIQLSMLDATIALHWPEGMAGHTWLGDGTETPEARFAQDLVFQTADGFITCGAVTDAEWISLCRALEKPEWTEDPRFGTPSDRMVHAPERLALMQEVLAEHTSVEWLDRLEAEDVPCAPVLDLESLTAHPQIRESGIVIEGQHPVGGPMRQPRPPERMVGTPSELRRPAPMLGEHTSEILTEIGADDAEIERLRARGVLGAWSGEAAE